MYRFDIGIIGNGAVGSLAALLLSLKFPNQQIALFGPETRTGSASTAAGAMLNVYSEIDYDQEFDDYQSIKLEMGEYSTKRWLNFLDRFNLEHLLTADDMVIYRSENCTELESRCFDAVKKAVDTAGRLDTKSQRFSEVNHFFNVKGGEKECFLIDGEGAVDTKQLFDWLRKALNNQGNLSVIKGFAQFEIEGHDIHVRSGINNSSPESFECNRVIIACGSFSESLLKDAGIDGVLPQFFGIGTALEVFGDSDILDIFPKRMVFRTPNRGSTCGLHFVPRNVDKGEYYIGAGSAISKDPQDLPRIGTIKYLIDSFFQDLRVYDSPSSKLALNIVTGFRPVSIDGRPLLGPLTQNENIFLVSGTKRDGLTNFFSIYSEIENWIKSDSMKYEMFAPQRVPVSFGDVDFSTEVYVANKLAGLIEHGTTRGKQLDILQKELREEAFKFHKTAWEQYPMLSGKAIHPELLNVL